MKIYKVKVNGIVYEVELESVSESAKQITSEAKQEVKEEVKAQPAQVASGEGTVIKAPMQGNIIKVNVNVGDAVKKGQVVCVLEAMKLENDIVTPVDGVVKQVLIEKGQQVNNQETIVVIG